MAKSEGTKGAQTELVGAGAGTQGTAPGEDEAQRRLADVKAAEERLAREKRALEEEKDTLRRQQRQVEERHKALDARAEEMESGPSRLSEVESAGRQAVREYGFAGEESEVAVLNNSARAIGAPNGTPLLPLKVTKLPGHAWRRWFGRDGNPVAGVAKYFKAEGANPPALQQVSLRNLSALPEEHALGVVESSKDAGLLAKFQDTESREGVKAAISARLQALKAQR